MNMDRAVYLSRFTAKYINQLCTINHLDLTEVKTKQERIEFLCSLPNMKEPIDDYPSSATAMPAPSDLGQILEKLEVLRRIETENLCQSLVKAMTEATKTSVASIRVGPELPYFHKLSSDDDITCYLATFERMAQAAGKPKEDWPRLLEPYLTGKAQKAFYALKDEDKKDYQKIVNIILRHYQLTPEAYRVKFKTAVKEQNETFEEFSTRLELYFRRWLKPSHESDEIEDVQRMFEQILIDQFLSTIRNDNLRLKLREKKLCTVQAIARCADEHMLNRRNESTQSHTSAPHNPPQRNDYVERSPLQPDNTEKQNSSSETGAGTTPPRRTGFELVCFKCRQLGHRAFNCPIQGQAPRNETRQPTQGTETENKSTRPEIPPKPPNTSSSSSSTRVSYICPSSLSSDPNSDDRGPTVMVKINNSTEKALIDTGSPVSLVSLSLCQSLGLNTTEPTVGPLVTVNGTQFHALGTHTGMVEVAGAHVPVVLHQVDGLAVPLILGRDFAMTSKLGMDFSSRSYWLQPEGDESCVKWPLLGLPPDRDFPTCDKSQSVEGGPLPCEEHDTKQSFFSPDDDIHFEKLLSDFPDALPCTHEYQVDGVVHRDNRHATIDVEPSMLMLGRKLMTPLSNKWNALTPAETPTDEETLRTQIEASQRRAQAKRKKHYDHRRATGL